MNSIAERLFDLRTKNKLSQTEVAHRMSVTPALISAYEKSERSPSLERLILLADIYRVSTDYILGRTSSGTDDAVLLDVSDLTDQQIRLVRELIEQLRH